MRGLICGDVFPVCFDVEGDNGGPALDAQKFRDSRRREGVIGAIWESPAARVGPSSGSLAACGVCVDGG